MRILRNMNWMMNQNKQEQSTLPYVVGDVSQFRLSQSYGRDRLLESGQSTLLWSAVLRTVGTGYFFRCFLSFEMQNDSSQPKNGKSTARKTRPTLVKKMAMLDEDLCRGEPMRFCSCSCFLINQSINQSIDRTIELSWTEKYCEN